MFDSVAPLDEFAETPPLFGDSGEWLRNWSEADGLELNGATLLTGWDGQRWSPNETVDWMLSTAGSRSDL
ncbi:MAG: hypothetical protein AAGJ56_10615 [Myxococcota bacterium]